MRYKPIRLDELLVDDLSDDIEICLGCGFQHCTCEPQDCAACDGVGCVDIAEPEEEWLTTEECKACEGEGQFYPPRMTVGEIKKRKGYS
jgi:DnaJ-class molecular chaperone